MISRPGVRELQARGDVGEALFERDKLFTVDPEQSIKLASVKLVSAYFRAMVSLPNTAKAMECQCSERMLIGAGAGGMKVLLNALNGLNPVKKSRCPDVWQNNTWELGWILRQRHLHEMTRQAAGRIWKIRPAVGAIVHSVEGGLGGL